MRIRRGLKQASPSAGPANTRASSFETEALACLDSLYRTARRLTRDRGAEPTLENAADTAIAIEKKGSCGAIYHAISEEDILRIMRYPFTMIASDGDIPVFGRAAPHAHYCLPRHDEARRS